MDVEMVPIGTDVEVTRQDGGVVRGTLTARDDHQLQVVVGPTTRSILRDEVANVEVVEGGATPPLPTVARFREFRVPEGTVLALRLDSSLGSDTSHVGDVVEAFLAEAVVIDGVTVLPEDSVVNGVVTTADPSGAVSGRASLAVRFQSVSVDGRDAPDTLSGSFQQTAASTRGTDVRRIGIPAAGGAVLGAVLGGKKGAAVGTIIGGGAGAAIVLTTAGEDIHLPRGTALSLALDDAIDVRVPIVR